MCALQYPFNSVDGTQRALAREVLKNEPERIPECFSEELNMLVKFLLEKDGSKRPSINQILKFPLIKERIPALLSTDDFQEEFSHTVLHGRDVFAEKKAAKKAGKGLVNEQELKPAYEPKNGVEKGHFDAAFQNYVDHLNNPDALKKPKDAQNPYVERDPNAEYGGQQTEGDDSEGHSDHEGNADDEEAMEKAREALLGRSTMRNIEKDLMDLTKASPKQFAAKMKVRFGDDTFVQGYDILNKNKKIVIAGEDSEL